jgi:hypothetical protein
VSEEHFTGREGVRAVDAAAAAMRILWRETPAPDIGIDGQLEHLDADRRATGGLVAVQVKSGPSYMHIDGDHIVLYPEPKHRHYWELFPIPVLLVIHDPSAARCYWADARQALRNPIRGESAAICVPLANVLDRAHKDKLFENCGILGAQLSTIDDLVAEMARSTDRFDISFLDLFVLGLTDLAHALFFHVGIYADLMEDRNGSFAFNSKSYDFIHDYVRFLVGQRLIRYDIADFVTDWDDKEMTPVFLAKLTNRGRAIVAHLHKVVPDEADGVVCEGFVGLVRTSVITKSLRLRALVDAVRALQSR